jgi:hypothetical protein
MADDLIPIEERLRLGEVLDHDAHLVMRGWPVDVAGSLRNADLTRSRYSLAGEPFVAISAEVTGHRLDPQGSSPAVPAQLRHRARS